MIEVRVSRNWRVCCEAKVPLRSSGTAVWGQMRDFKQFVTLDPFHSRVMPLLDTTNRQRFLLLHGFGPLGFHRLGKMLHWNPGKGFAFSDLSRRSPQKGFPHIYEYSIESTGENVCCLAIYVRGRWTAVWMPRWLVKSWLSFVMKLIEHRLARYFRLLARYKG